MSGHASGDRYLEAMGIRRWKLRDGSATEPDEQDVAVAQTAEVPVASQRSADALAEPATDTSSDQLSDQGVWSVLRQRVSNCTACALHETRMNTVLGAGDTYADWLIVGEAPGEEEDQSGEPFVGKAGQLLNEMLLAVGFQRSDVYIANTIKCRPPDNRDPLPEETEACAGFLQEQIELVEPRFILAVGLPAAKRLLGLDGDPKLANLRGKVHHYGDSKIPLVVTYHPAYYFHQPQQKRKGWDDLLFARQVAAGNS